MHEGGTPLLLKLEFNFDAQGRLGAWEGEMRPPPMSAAAVAAALPKLPEPHFFNNLLDCCCIDPRLLVRRVDIRLHSNQEIFVATGTVKWFNASKGFGFIQADDGSKDVFVHISAVEKAGLSNLNEGQKIQYELQKGKDGKTSAGDLKSI